jgi:RHS repeat-associated protein
LQAGFIVAKVTDFWQSAQNSPTSVRDYVDPFQYVNGVLTEISTDEGRWTPSGGYEYFIKDHLGNVRVAFGSSGITQYSDYDPWGLALPTLSGGSSTNRLKYNGKEAITEVGASVYDYGARLYDAQIGRWGVPDPLAELSRRFSPFVYGNNNPVRFIDPDGMATSEYYQGQAAQDKFAEFLASHTLGEPQNSDDPKPKPKLSQVSGGIFSKTGPGVGIRKDDTGSLEIYDTQVGRVPNSEFNDPFLEIIHLLYGVDFTGKSSEQTTLSDGSRVIASSPAFLQGVGGIAGKGFKSLTQLGLKDGMKVTSSQALDYGEQFLGKGYQELVPGSGRYISADGKRVFRMGVNDITGAHGGGPHVNFETLVPNPAKPGRMMVNQNFHIYLTR